MSLRSRKGDWLLAKHVAAGERTSRASGCVSFPRVDGDDHVPPTLDHFFLQTLTEASGGPQTSQYAFVRTLDDQTRQYGFCCRTRRHSEENEGEPDSVEVICILSRYLWFSTFNTLLAMLTTMRGNSLSQPDSWQQLGATVEQVYDSAVHKFPLARGRATDQFGAIQYFRSRNSGSQ